jgi:hypothetical protein
VKNLLNLLPEMPRFKNFLTERVLYAIIKLYKASKQKLAEIYGGKL